MLGGAAVAAIATLVAPVAAAEPTADELIDEGVALRREGDEAEALERFRRAHEIDAASPRALAQMALAEKSLRRYIEAEAHLAAALNQPEHPWIAKNREALDAAMALLVKQLGWVEVISNVPDAELLINGAPAGRLPADPRHRVVAGRVVVEVRAEGYVTGRREVELPAEETTEVALSLQALPPPEPTPEPVAPKPKALVSAPVLDPPPEPEPSWTPWIVGTGALGLAGVAVGTGLGIRVLQLKSERDELCPDPEPTDQGLGCSEDAVSIDGQARNYSVGSTVAFAVGGVAAVTALVLWLVEPEANEVEALLSPRGGGWRVRF